MKPYLFLLSLALIGSSCVTKKKYLAFQGEQQALVKTAEKSLADCQFQLSQQNYKAACVKCKIKMAN
jgi:hypothetical protein